MLFPVAVRVLMAGFLMVRVAEGVITRTRVYYLAAVEVDWDYAPLGNRVTADNSVSDQFIKQGPNRIGSVYRKILYRQYTDATFSTQVAPLPSHGMLGPTLRAETGDKIVVVFKNLAYSANRSLSVHPHGVQYSKDSEGALYVDNTSGADKEDEMVAPGEVHSYVWRIPASFAPTAFDDACLPFVYHSHVFPTKEVDSGLVGLLLSCKKGTLYRWGRRKGQRRDVSADFPIYLDTADENDSWLARYNLQKCGDPDACTALFNSSDAGFRSSNLMRHVNGRMYGNLEGLEVNVAARWSKPYAFYFFSVNRGITSVHISGQVMTVRQRSADTVTLFPATFLTGFIRPSYPGFWLLASRITEAFAGGQQAFLKVNTGYPVWGFGRKKRDAISFIERESTNLDLALESDQEASESGRRRRHAVASVNLTVASDPEQQAMAEAQVNITGQNLSQRTLSSWGRRVRRYYLVIEDYVWDYGPIGLNLYDGGSLTEPGSPAATYFTQGPHRIGGRYRKTRYVQYTDGTFTKRIERGEAEVHLGMLGPVLKAEEGETVVVRVLNNASRAYSFQPHGVVFNKDNEGFVYRDPTIGQLAGHVVEAGDSATYRFRVPTLRRSDLPCVTRTYHSAVDPARDIATGLLGPLLLCKRGQLPRQGGWWSRYRNRSSSVRWYRSHQHLYLNFLTVDENLSWHLQHNIDTYTSDPAGVDVNDAGFRSANRKHAINGRMYGNLEGLSVCLGDNVAWHLFGVGGQFDMHGVNFQGQTLDITGNHVNARVVIPGTAMTMTSTPDTVGNWSVACRTNFHFVTGMKDTYEVKSCGSEPQMPWKPDGVTRRYFVAAQEVLWDYAPVKHDPATGENITDDSQFGYRFIIDNDEFIGSVYKKARYIEYTDATFTTEKTRTPDQIHLGILGPVLQAEVGDVIEVVFFNNASRPFSMHPQGVQYDKENEGANYVDSGDSVPVPTTTSAGVKGDAVPPGATFTYTWRVPERAGPGKNDPDCVAWMYYSSVNSVKDMSSGLVGPLLVCERGSGFVTGDGNDNSSNNGNGTGKTRDKRDAGNNGNRSSSSSSPSSSFSGFRSHSHGNVDREFWMLYYVFDENLSWYLGDNIKERAPLREGRESDSAFVVSNQMNSINGLIYANVKGLIMDEGDVVSWYLLGLGSSFDYHPVHFHGQTIIHRTDRPRRGDVTEVFPSTSAVVRMVCDNPGTWIVHCHLADHVLAGMEATYTIRPAAAE